MGHRSQILGHAAGTAPKRLARVSHGGPLKDTDQPAQPARKPATWWEAWRSNASPLMS
jgi:hypothetical protein